MAAFAPVSVGELSSAARRARRLAHEVHAGQRDRHGEPMIDHVERVLAAVPEEARAVAAVHDVCERSGLTPTDVAASLGLGAAELRAIELLTKLEGESLVEHARRVLGEHDPQTGAIALAVKRADVADHLRRTGPDDPAYDEVAALLGL